MARSRDARPEIVANPVYLGGVAETLAGKVFGPDGPAWGTTSEDLEELGCPLRLERWDTSVVVTPNLSSGAHYRRRCRNPPDAS
jgi:hypothetical protein